MTMPGGAGDRAQSLVRRGHYGHGWLAALRHACRKWRVHRGRRSTAGVGRSGGEAASVTQTGAATPTAAPDPFTAWPGWIQPGGFTPGDPGNSPASTTDRLP